MPKTLKLPCSKPRFDLTTRLLYLSLVILYFYFVFSLPRLALCLNVCMTYVGLETQGRSWRTPRGVCQDERTAQKDSKRTGRCGNVTSWYLRMLVMIDTGHIYYSHRYNYPCKLLVHYQHYVVAGVGNRLLWQHLLLNELINESGKRKYVLKRVKYCFVINYCPDSKCFPHVLHQMALTEKICWAWAEGIHLLLRGSSWPPRSPQVQPSQGQFLFFFFLPVLFLSVQAGLPYGAQTNVRRFFVANVKGFYCPKQDFCPGTMQELNVKDTRVWSLGTFHGLKFVVMMWY